MKAVAAREAKNRFGTLMDTAQREPVAIEKHGRAVAVLMSLEEYRHIKLERLRTEVGQGIDQLDNGEFVEMNSDDLQEFFTDIRARGDERRALSD